MEVHERTPWRFLSPWHRFALFRRIARNTFDGLPPGKRASGIRKKIWNAVFLLP